PSRNFPPFPTRRSSDLEAHERKKAVGRSAGDEPDLPRLGKRPKGRRDVTAIALLELAEARLKPVPVVEGERVEPGIVTRPRHFRSEEHTSELQSRVDLV